MSENQGKPRFQPRYVFLLLLLALLLAGCPKPGPVPARWQPEGQPQDLAVFAQQIGEERPLVSPETQARADEAANRRFFAPWQQNRTGVTSATVAPYGIAEGKFTPRGFAENLQAWDALLWEGVARNCNAAAFPSLAPQGVVTGQIGGSAPNSAIITQNTALRVLPTLRPMFTDPAKAGQGYPFDMLQNSAIWVGTPVHVAHSSADGAWFYCEAAYASGWVPAQHVAFVDEEFRTQYAGGRYVAILRDESPIRDHSGNFLTLAHIGAVFPLARWVPDEPLSVMVPRRDLSGRAVIEDVPLEEGIGAVKPLPMTPALLAVVGNRMMGKAYGWGGLYEDRDCSATLRDLFAAFGFWLPRNSAAQAKAGLTVSLEKMSGNEKERVIRERGKPFRTLVCMPGHIGLYVGQWQGKAAMYHTIWGLRTMDGETEGRLVIGKTAITSLDPGKDIPQVKTILLDRISSLAVLGESD